MDITLNIFGRESIVRNIKNLDNKGKKAVYDCLFEEWKNAHDTLDYEKADKLESHLEFIQNIYE